MFRILELIWNAWNEAHIARHGIVSEEVEEVCFSSERLVVKIRRDRYRVIGQTEAGRYLTVILDGVGRGRFYVVTAREASSNERRQRHRWRGD